MSLSGGEDEDTKPNVATLALTRKTGPRCSHPLGARWPIIARGAPVHLDAHDCTSSAKWTQSKTPLAAYPIIARVDDADLVRGRKHGVKV